ncbi:hypothetical protein [Nocardioides alkalitolerans]|uniref:hypothetical protein n=1 Tax=Nocardioides alkalitolerans TaxID=281714 RepID=UPI00048DCEF3|nr:hypothetical protein [Nocardioides alkalitolerans]
MSFTDPSPSEITPIVRVDLGAPLGVRTVTSWDLERELVAAAVAGTVRGPGLSIGSGNLTIAHTDLSRTPWAKGALRIKTGGEAVLVGEASDGETMALDTWLVGPKSGSIGGASISVPLREKQYAGRRQQNLLPILAGAHADPAWIVDVLARQLGYYTTPPPVPSALTSLPMNGAVWEEANAANPSEFEVPTGWGALRGALGPTGLVDIAVQLGVSGWIYTQGVYIPMSDPRLMRDEPLFWTLDVRGVVEGWFGYGPTGQVHIRIDRDAGELAIRGGTSRAWVTVPFTPGANGDYPDRVQVQIERTGTPDPSDNPRSSIGTFGPSRARARSSATAPWSAWAVEPWVGVTNGIYDLAYKAAAGSSFAAAQVTTVADPLLWKPPTADIDKLGGIIVAPYLPATTDVWSGIQAVASSWLAAAWRDRDGVLRLRERGYLAGNGPVRESIDVGRKVEDLPWTLDPADTADRLVVQWSPVDVVTPIANEFPVLWEAPEALRVDPGKSVTLMADLDRLGFEHGTQFSPSNAVPWYPMWSIYGEQLSTWSANPERDGSGPQPGDGALQITTRRISAGRVEVTIRNASAQVLWTVDAQGNPHLKMRGWGRMDQNQPATIERGVPEDLATNKLEVSLGSHVQRAEDAEAIADHLYARLSAERMFRINSLRVVPDWSRDIGQIVELFHERSALRVKALIVKVAMSGDGGSVTQQLDVVWLVPTYRDLREAWVGRSYADLKAHWAGRTYADLTDDPLSTGA